MRLAMCAVIAAVAMAASSAASAKVLSFCSDADPEGFDPALYVTRTTFDASAQTLYNRLVEFERGSTELRPGLAERWEVSEDGLAYTFHLRPGVRFHATPYFTPSRELNADDVVFSLLRQHDPSHSWHAYAGGSWPFYAGLSLDGAVKSIRKLDDLTVEIGLERPMASLPAILAMDFASILSKEYADALAAADARDLLDVQPIGTGPFVFLGHDTKTKVGFAANPHYWRGRQPADMLIFWIEPDPVVRLEKLVAGDCHVIAQPDPATLAAAAANEAIEIAEAERADVAYLAVNTRTPPFGDVRIRRAIGLAIDRQAIVDEVYAGGGIAADGLMPSSMLGYNPSAAAAQSDPEAASALLAEAGVSGLSFDLLTMTAARPYNPDPERVARMIAADLAKIGLEVRVSTEDLVGEFLQKASDPDRSGAVLLGWTSDNGDPGAFLSLLLSCDAVGASNRAQWCNAPFDDLVRRAASGDEETRALLYGEAQQMLAVHQPLIALAHTVVSVPMARTVTGFAASPLGVYNFEGVDGP